MESKNRLSMRIRSWFVKAPAVKLAVLCLSILVVCSLFVVVREAEQMIICNDISEYGRYTGTGADDFVQEYISCFFPERIEEYFSNVNYLYKAAGRNAYDFEAYLEFTITDSDVFFRYIEGIAPQSVWETFSFDTDFQIYMLENRLDIIEGMVTDPESDLYHPIESAKIRAVLYNAETQTVIFWALGVYDGGGIGTNFLNTFFTRFSVNPLVYEQTADSSHGYDPFELD